MQGAVRHRRTFAESELDLAMAFESFGGSLASSPRSRPQTASRAPNTSGLVVDLPLLDFEFYSFACLSLQAPQ